MVMREEDKTRSEETKKKMSEKAKGRIPWNKGLKLKNRKRTLCINYTNLNGN